MRLAVRWCWLFLAVSSAQALNVRKIDLEGFNRVPVADIRAGLPLRPGQAYETAHGDEARSWLMGLGLFVSVDLSTRPEGGVVDLRFKVVENPDVRVVRFEGNTQVAAAAFRMDLLTQPRKILNRRELARDVAVIGKTYLEQGMRVVVETAYDPEPTDPATPVAVIFKITEIKIGKVEIEPIHYLRREKLAPLLLLKAGDLVVESALLEQRQKLGASGLFDQVHPPATSEPSAEGTVDVLYRVQERDNPVLTREYLELIDLARLVRHVRFNAVDVSVDSRDLEVYVPAAELRTRLQAAQQAAQARPQDAEALYEWFQLARRLGVDASEPARRLKPLLAALGNQPVAQLRLGYALSTLDERDGATQAFEAASQDPATRLAAYQELLGFQIAALGSGGRPAAEKLRGTVTRAAEALAALPEKPSLTTLTEAFKLYYTALTVSFFDTSAKAPLRLDGPASRRLINGIYQTFEASRASLTDAEKRHLGRLLTAVGFAAQAAGGEAAKPATWAEFAKLLEVARNVLLVAGLEQTDDTAAWFYVAFNDVLRDDLASARDFALKGLLRDPNSERLVDVYVLTCVQGRTAGGDPKKSLDLLGASIRDIQGRMAAHQMSGWGSLMLLAKLHLAVRDTAPETATAEREQARQAAEAAALGATQADPARASGWWILGLSRLKGPAPATALPAYQKVVELRPTPESHYAVALAQLAAGQTDAGLKAMAALGR